MEKVLLDNDIRKLHKAYEKEIIMHGRLMALLGFIIGLALGNLW